ncbi:MAG: 5-bromo-4-chloroindolyl phosphate hydrolysis family protein [Acidobacteriota bacterium]
MALPPLAREVLAGSGASALLIGLAVASTLSFPAMLALAASAYFGFRLVLPVRSSKDRGQEKVAETAPQRAAERVVMGYAETFQHLAGTIADTEIRGRVSHLAEVVAALVEPLRRDEKNLHLAKDVLQLHLPKAQTLVERYAFLERQPYLDDSARAALLDLRETLDLTVRAFESVHHRLLADDVRALDVDRRVYEELLRLEDRLGDPDGYLAGAPRVETPRETS